MTATTSGGDAATRETLRLLSVAIGTGGRVVAGDYTYAVMRVRLHKNSYDSYAAARSAAALVRIDKAGNHVVLQTPRVDGVMPGKITFTPLTGDTGKRIAVRRSDREAADARTTAQAETVTAALDIVRAVHAPLLAEAGEDRAAIAACSTVRRATADTVKAMTLRAAPLPATPQLADAVKATVGLRDTVLPALRSAVSVESGRLAADVMAEMSARPASVAEFAALGYDVVARSVGYEEPRSYNEIAHDVPVLLHNGEVAADAPARAPTALAQRRQRTTASRAAKRALLAGAGAITPLLTGPEIPAVRSIDETIALIKTALGPSRSVEVDGVVYENRRAVVERDGEREERDVLFRIAPRDPRVPAPLRVNTALEPYPAAGVRIHSVIADPDAATAERTMATYGAYAAADDETIRTLDTAVSDEGRALTTLAAGKIVRAVLAEETARYIDYRGLLAAAERTSGPATVATLDASIPTVTAASSVDTVVRAVLTLRDKAIPAAEAAADRVATEVVPFMRSLYSGNGAVDTEAERRGYGLQAYDVTYVTQALGPRVHKVTLFTLRTHSGPDGLIALQPPPERHPQYNNSRLADRHEGLDHATALRVLRDARDFMALARGNVELSGRPERHL